ncbi:hypothetical protein [Bradyrhizobium sp. SBR1B]|uniref:hypothetical protein n=1 Tax=Bradyrhizobium sp. SBR1B TaxID=2663836 RepID=UPI001605FED5|nr:hypothetical protein [Bradyrhizobium sp. SBR1B]MBB4379985.1 hypothetical protein [Bradyrhizobium sp. SBR1B]
MMMISILLLIDTPKIYESGITTSSLSIGAAGKRLLLRTSIARASMYKTRVTSVTLVAV